jgi:uncharacterized protein YjiS (DUF1127 family)
MIDLVLPSATFVAGTARSISASAAAALARARKRRAARATVAELASLDDRTLQDIGIHRTEIVSVAYAKGLDRFRRQGWR